VSKNVFDNLAPNNNNNRVQHILLGLTCKYQEWGKIHLKEEILPSTRIQEKVQVKNLENKKVT
jgi:hypothetical protein